MFLKIFHHITFIQKAFISPSCPVRAFRHCEVVGIPGICQFETDETFQMRGETCSNKLQASEISYSCVCSEKWK